MKRILFLVLLLFSFGCGKRSHVYRVGVDPTFFPLDIKGKEANVFAFSNELLQEIAKIKNVQLEKVSVSWDNLLWGLKEKRYDAILSSMHPYVFNKKKYAFSNPYLLTGPVLVTAVNAGFHSLDQMQGKIVGIEENSSEMLILDRYPSIIPREYLMIPNAFMDLKEQQVDGVLLGVIQATTYVNNLYAGVLKIAGAPLDDQGLRLITLENHEAKLINWFNEGLEELKRTNKYEALIKKWKL